MNEMTDAIQSDQPQESAASSGPAAAPAPRKNASGIAVFTAGQHFPQFFVLLFVNIAMLYGAFLPWYGGADAGTGMHTYAGAVIGFVSIGAVLASLSSIFSGRLVIWPTLLNWIIADCFVVSRLLSIVRDNGETIGKVFSPDFKEGLTELGNIVGVGFVFITVSAVFMLFFLVVSVFSGAKQQAKKKEAQKAARTTSRKKK